MIPKACGQVYLRVTTLDDGCFLPATVVNAIGPLLFIGDGMCFSGVFHLTLPGNLGLSGTLRLPVRKVEVTGVVLQEGDCEGQEGFVGLLLRSGVCLSAKISRHGLAGVK